MKGLPGVGVVAVAAALAAAWWALGDADAPERGGPDGPGGPGPGAESSDPDGAARSPARGPAPRAAAPRPRADAPEPAAEPPPGEDERALRRAAGLAAGADPAVVANLRPASVPGSPRPTPPGWGESTERRPAARASAASAALRAVPRNAFDAGATGPRAVGDAAAVAPIAAGDDPPARKGLRGDYYDFLEGEIAEVPDLAALPPTLTRMDARVDFATDAQFALPFEPETFAALWRGYLVVETAGEYAFTCGSDDGVRVRIGGEVVVEHTWLRPYAESGGRVTLAAGRHPIEVAFYENYVFASCRLFWEGPGVPRQVVPGDAFEPPDDLAAVEPPAVSVVVPAAAMVGDVVDIVGRGFPDDPALVRVTFDGAEAEVVASSATWLRARVPVGAATGPVVVQVGPLSTRPVGFTVENLLGLYGEYFLVGTALDTFPDFDRATPEFVRTDGPFDFGDDGLWDLPHDPDVFAARWRGLLWVPADDEYEFTLGSDDGGTLLFDDEVWIDLPGLHPYEEGARRARFTRGFHPVELRFFENYGAAHLRLFWQRRGDPARTLVPKGCLFPPDAVGARAEPRVTAIEPSTAVAGDEVEIRGSGFGADRSTVRVAFPHDVWARPTAVSDDRLRVRVPRGTASGDLRVHAGVRASAALPFRLGEDVGLRGAYHELAPGDGDDPAALLASLEGRSPTLVRTDARFRFGDAGAWDVPFASAGFAVRWTGTLAVETAQNLLVAPQSEGSMILRIGGRTVVEDLDPHTLREGYGSVVLEPGEHAVEILVAARGAAPRFHWFVTPHGRADHVEVPAARLRPREPRN